MPGSTVYENAEVEPYAAVNPANPSNILGIWQQDRWSDGGAHGLVAAYSFDGGMHWGEQPFIASVCAGGDIANGADYARASDPWVSFSPNGVAYITAIAFTGDALVAGSVSAVLVSRSMDGGVTWSNPVALIVDHGDAFNDKETVTADANDSNIAYEVWDRLDSDNHGPTYFARTTDGGQTWEPARSIYDPGIGNQTIGNEIAVLSGGDIVDVFEEIDGGSTAVLRVIRSSDHGSTWSAPDTITQDLSVGTQDPNTGTRIRDGGGLPQVCAGIGGNLAVVWQDARFSDGQRDGIALSQSSDDGQTWSVPVEINAVPSVPAFTPSIAMLADGTIGVSYFDFRNNPSNPKTLLTDYWLTASSDGTHWSEQHVSGPFNLDLAPNSEGLFLGDYQSLAVMGQAFVPFYVQTTNQNTDDPTDVYVLPPRPLPVSSARGITHVVAVSNYSRAPDRRFQHAVRRNLSHLLRSENPSLKPRHGVPPPRALRK